jgi:hypothetical protein
MRKASTIRYRCPDAWGGPPIGLILMGDGKRVRRAYLVLGAKKAKSSSAGLGVTTWRLTVESMSAERGREEIAAGCPHWSIVWDSRSKRN